MSIFALSTISSRLWVIEDVSFLEGLEELGEVVYEAVFELLGLAVLLRSEPFDHALDQFAHFLVERCDGEFLCLVHERFELRELRPVDLGCDLLQFGRHGDVEVAPGEE